MDRFGGWSGPQVQRRGTPLVGPPCRSLVHLCDLLDRLVDRYGVQVGAVKPAAAISSIMRGGRGKRATDSGR